MVFTLLSLVTIGIPVYYAHASFFSHLFTNAEAETISSLDHNIQNMVLPDPNVEIVRDIVTHKKIALEDSTTDSIEQGLLEPIVGPLGTSVDADEVNDAEEISVYTVHAGDTISKIARLFDVSENTIRWANNMKKGESPKVGATLVILPVDGVSYVVKKGDNLKSIARIYGADAEEIGKFNGLELDSELAYGETIIIPDGEITEPKEKKKNSVKKILASATKIIKGSGSGKDLGTYFMRPIRGGTYTQGLHDRGAVDIAAPIGTPILAAAEGTVLIAKTGGYNWGSGNYIVISHPNGTRTLYAHLSYVGVTQGQYVEKGTQIGKVGSTGKSTGPHLHFQVQGAKNPLGTNPRYGL
jgi:murein DD-endopeptidase MepM/ murein hydrolase activator NlpD